jgi:hypothetical protein
MSKAGQQFNEKSLAAELSTRLSGFPVDGTRPVASAQTGPAKTVVWIDAGDEVLVHLDSVSVRMIGQTLLVSVDLDTDQTGRTPLIVSLALSSGSDAAGLVAVTDELPHGNGLLAARWGSHFQAAVWASVLGIAQDFSAQGGGVPRSLTISNGVLNLEAGAPLQAPSPPTNTGVR